MRKVKILLRIVVIKPFLRICLINVNIFGKFSRMNIIQAEFIAEFF